LPPTAASPVCSRGGKELQGGKADVTNLFHANPGRLPVRLRNPMGEV
jgi:hypothetical protein